MDESVIFIDETPVVTVVTPPQTFEIESRRYNTRARNNGKTRQNVNVIDLTNNVDIPANPYNTRNNLTNNSISKEQPETLSESIRARNSDVCNRLCCPVCLESLLTGKTIAMTLGCGHIFCSTCIRLILSKDLQECSLCKSKVTTDPIRLYI